MELIVKIGADQQALSDTIQRMKENFKAMNSSGNMPGSWSSVSSSPYGNILKSASADGGFEKFKSELSELSPVLGGIAGKVTHLLGPLAALAAGIGGLGAIASSVGNKISEAAALSRQSRITGASAGMLKTFGRAAELGGMDKESAFTALNRLNAQAGAFNQGDAEAQKLFGELGIDPSGQKVDDVLIQIKNQFKGITDPAKRARLSKGLFGRGGFEMSEVFGKMDMAQSGYVTEGRDIEDIAAMKKNSKKFFNSVNMMFDELTTRVTAVISRGAGLSKGSRKGELSQTIGEEVEVEVKKAIEKQKIDAVVGGGKLETLYRWRDGSMHSSREPKEKVESDKMAGFQADAMQQAGLFTGSSLLFNPDMGIQQMQLDALNAIRDNTYGMKGSFE